MIERTVLFVWHLLIGWGGLILGGVYGAIRGFEELLKVEDSLLFRFRDYPVFEIIDKPKGYATQETTGYGRIPDALLDKG